MIPVYIISGFLGSGKTTLIQSLLNRTDVSKVAVIENDFGEVSFDAAVLKRQGVRLEELPSGCICCTLVGNFKESLRTVLKDGSAELIVIEPSGVAKLSDIKALCESAEFAGNIGPLVTVTVVDGSMAVMYAENFGEFFVDQLREGQVIVVNRTDDKADEKELRQLLQRENEKAQILFEIPEDLDFAFFASLASGIKTHGHLCTCGCGPDGHDHHCHEHEEHCHGHEHEEAPFQTLTVRVDTCRTEAEWEETLKRSLEAEPNILRVKGIVKVPSGYATVQYSGQHIDISGTVEADTVMTFIGTSLSEEDLRPLWSY